MSISYNKLWKVLIDRNMKKTDLIKKCNIDSNILAKMGKKQYISLRSLEKICSKLNCNIEDIIEFEKGEDNNV
jgi:hypothetical protein rflaF_16146